MLSTSTSQLLGSFDKVDKKLRLDTIYMGCIPAILTAPVPVHFPQAWALHDFDHSIEAHWKRMNSEQRTLLYKQHESAIAASKPDYATRRRMLVQDFESFGYKPPVALLRSAVPADDSAPVHPNKKSPANKTTRTLTSVEPKRPSSTLSLESTVPPRGFAEPRNDSPQRRVIYEVMDVRLDKASKRAMLSVRYNAGKNTDWIFASQVLDEESEAVLTQVLIKLK